jgi:ABC-type molybdate transport system substrate-binding protein
MTLRRSLAAVMLLMAAAAAGAQTTRPTLSVYAAGSLRAALNEVARAFEQERAVAVAMSYGASGLLKDRLAGGEAAQVFASANMEHPQALVNAGKAQAVVAFTRNALCLLATPAFSLQGKSVAQRLLDADVRLGTSTPKADPAGDYAFAMFDLIESTGAAAPGSAAALKAKAQQLTGGPNSPPPPTGRSVYGEIVAARQVDAFVTYCTGATQARQEQPTLQLLALPEGISVSARYGMVLLLPVGADAQAYAQFVLGAKGQAILATHGFSAP